MMVEPYISATRTMHLSAQRATATHGRSTPSLCKVVHKCGFMQRQAISSHHITPPARWVILAVAQKVTHTLFILQRIYKEPLIQATIN